MKYVIIGAGGTGGMLGHSIAGAKKDVTIIARGEHLKKINENGLTVEKMWDGSRDTVAIKAVDMEHYSDTPDVIIVCVKGYSIDGVLPFIRKIATKDTIIIPILNIYGTGGRLQEQIPDSLVTDGCIYVSANIKEPGVIEQHGEILRVVFGVRNSEEYKPVLAEIAKDLSECDIEVILSDNIQRDTLVKFSYVSPMGVAALYYDAPAGEFQKEGAPREMFCELIREVEAIAAAMGITFEESMVERNLKILAPLEPVATTSMQRDVMAGKQSEIDGLLYEVIRMGKKYGVETPCYERAAAKIEGMMAEQKQK